MNIHNPQWVSELAHRMCFVGGLDEWWELCAGLCKIKPDFAELLFPHLLFGIYLAKPKTNSPLYNKMSEILGKALMQEKANVAAIRLIIQSLDYFRSFRQVLDTRVLSQGASLDLF
jgi:hypothetical protein